MTVTLRTTSNTKATNKGASLSHAELDGNFVHFLDTGITVVGDDSSGTQFTPGDDLKIAGGTNITTAVSGPTLTVTGSSTPTFTSVTTNVLSADFVNILDNKITTGSNANLELTPGGTGTIVMPGITVDDNEIQANRSNDDLVLVASGTGSIDARANVRFNTTYTEDTVALTSSDNIVVDCSLATVFTITLAHSASFRIDNLSAGQTVTIIITQDGSGSRTGSFSDTSSTAIKFAGGTPTLTTDANAIDVVTIFNNGGTELGNIAKDFKTS